MSVPAVGQDLTGAGCPVRKLSRVGERLAPAVEYVGPDTAATADGTHGPRWVIRSHDLARQVIRSEDSLGQAGFGAASYTAPPGHGRRRQAGARRMRSPILYLEGAEHRTRRRAAARHFAPRITESYREMMEELTDQLIAPLAAGRPADLTTLSLRMAVQVAARVIGLTDSSTAGMTRRLEAFFEGDLTDRSITPAVVWRKLRTGTALLRFYHLDVRPAIRARRRLPQEDVISQLVELGYRPLEILIECVTYGAAGMATTRELITVAAWHLLDDAALLARYRAADLDGRTAILHEVLRLEPIVGHLFRRTTAPMTVAWNGSEQVLPVGTMIDLDLRAINADAGLVGAEPLALRPARPLSSRGVAPSVMSFGDGNHRCPGAPLAIMESEIFLTRLLALDLVTDGPPTIGWSDLTEGYDLRAFILRRRPG